MKWTSWTANLKCDKCLERKNRQVLLFARVLNSGTRRYYGVKIMYYNILDRLLHGSWERDVRIYIYHASISYVNDVGEIMWNNII